MLAKGPMVLNDIWARLFRFRAYTKGLVGDLSKAYYSMKTGELEKHVQRIVWRWGRKDKDWRVFNFVTVSLGDRLAATLLTISIKKCIRMFAVFDLEGAMRMEQDNYVKIDVTGGSTALMKRMKGKKQEDYTCTANKILGSGGFKVKAMVASCEENGQALAKLGGAVLGLGFSTEHYLLYVKCKANISKRRRGKPTGPDLKLEDLSDQAQHWNISRAV
jgi:hypothetical protein